MKKLLALFAITIIVTAYANVVKAQPETSVIPDVRLKLNDNCWVIVKSDDERFKLVGLYNAGYEKVFEGNAPYTIVVGNYKSAELWVRGELYDMTPHARNGIARFTLTLDSSSNKEKYTSDNAATIEAEYLAAYQMLSPSKRHYADAINAFNDFLVKYPESELASNAQYWLAEAHYVSRHNVNALAAFNKVISNYPQS